MKLEKGLGRSGFSTDKMMGFVSITDLEDAQQVTVSVKTLMHMGRLSEVLEKLGFEEIVITVEKNNPIILGGDTSGIGVATEKTEE